MTERETSLAHEWLVASKEIFSAITFTPGIDLSDRKIPQVATDLRGYAQAMEPLKALVLAGRIKASDPAIWQIVYAVRGGKFRPRYSELEEIVRAKLGARLPPPENQDAYRQVQAPGRPALPPGAGAPGAKKGAWIEHLPPTGDTSLDTLFASMMDTIEEASGPDAAVKNAKQCHLGRIEAAQKKQQHQDDGIPASQVRSARAKSKGQMIKAYMSRWYITEREPETPEQERQGSGLSKVLTSKVPGIGGGDE